VESIKLMSKTHPMEGGSEQMAPKSYNFDLLLEEDAKGLRKEVNIVLLGCFDSGKGSVIKEIESNNLSTYTTAELQHYRETILEIMISTMRKLLTVLRLETCDEIDQKHVAIVFQQHTPCQNISPELEDAITSLWKSRDTFLRIFEEIEEKPMIVNQAA